MMNLFTLLPTIPPPPSPYLHPPPSTIPLTPSAAILPPVLYYIALLFLAPIPSNPIPNLTSLLRTILALTAAILFIRLPLHYHVPFSVGLTYQLALVGLYGFCRILDIFILSPYLCDHTLPRRVKYHHAPRHDTTPNAPAQGAAAESYFTIHFLQPGKGDAVTETAISESGWPTGVLDRLSWALELELSMRGAGFTWTSADVRHTKRTWRPTVQDRTHSILVHVIPVMMVCFTIIRAIWTTHLAPPTTTTTDQGQFDQMPFLIQIILTASLGAFLMAAFSLGHSAFAIILSPLSPHPLSYFPPLYTLRIWQITSVRGFWSYGWHRLFSRLFLVYGVWPGEWVQRVLQQIFYNHDDKQDMKDSNTDVGKVLGAFFISALVHSFAAYTVVPGPWTESLGEAWFFAGNGVAVALEECVKGFIFARRRALKRNQLKKMNKQIQNDHEQHDKTVKEGEKEANKTVENQKEEEDDKKGLSEWYDPVIARIWWIAVLLYTGRNFARGWVTAGLVREMAFA